jgi:hypothetical protein
VGFAATGAGLFRYLNSSSASSAFRFSASILDTESGKQITALAINSDMDDLFYDSQTGRIYVSCGEGFVDVVRQQAADQYQIIGRIATIPGARTSAYSSTLNALFVGVPQRPADSAEILVLQAEK